MKWSFRGFCCGDAAPAKSKEAFHNSEWHAKAVQDHLNKADSAERWCPVNSTTASAAGQSPAMTVTVNTTTSHRNQPTLPFSPYLHQNLFTEVVLGPPPTSTGLGGPAVGLHLQQLVREVVFGDYVEAGSSGGKVLQGTWRGSVVALKIMVSSDLDDLELTTREALLSRSLSHPHLVQTYAVHVSQLSAQDLDPLTYSVPVHPAAAACRGKHPRGATAGSSGDDVTGPTDEACESSLVNRLLDSRLLLSSQTSSLTDLAGLEATLSVSRMGLLSRPSLPVVQPVSGRAQAQEAAFLGGTLPGPVAEGGPALGGPVGGGSGRALAAPSPGARGEGSQGAEAASAGAETGGGPRRASEWGTAPSRGPGPGSRPAPATAPGLVALSGSLVGSSGEAGGACDGSGAAGGGGKGGSVHPVTSVAAGNAAEVRRSLMGPLRNGSSAGRPQPNPQLQRPQQQQQEEGRWLVRSRTAGLAPEPATAAATSSSPGPPARCGPPSQLCSSRGAAPPASLPAAAAAAAASASPTLVPGPASTAPSGSASSSVPSAANGAKRASPAHSQRPPSTALPPQHQQHLRHLQPPAAAGTGGPVRGSKRPGGGGGSCSRASLAANALRLLRELAAMGAAPGCFLTVVVMEFCERGNLLQLIQQRMAAAAAAAGGNGQAGAGGGPPSLLPPGDGAAGGAGGHPAVESPMPWRRGRSLLPQVSAAWRVAAGAPGGPQPHPHPHPQAARSFSGDTTLGPPSLPCGAPGPPTSPMGPGAERPGGSTDGSYSGSGGGSGSDLSRMRTLELLRNALEIAQGMAYLHSLGLVHGDLKPANVLLRTMFDGEAAPDCLLRGPGPAPAPPADSGRGYCCKIADFGLTSPVLVRLKGSDWVERRPDGEKGMGAVPYMAPEVAGGARHGMPADVYSYGALLWHLVSGQPPHAHLHPVQILVGLVGGELALTWPPRSEPTLRKIGAACLAADPAARPPFDHIVKALLKAVARVAAGRRRPQAPPPGPGPRLPACTSPCERLALLPEWESWGPQQVRSRGAGEGARADRTQVLSADGRGAEDDGGGGGGGAPAAGGGGGGGGGGGWRQVGSEPAQRVRRPGGMLPSLAVEWVAPSAFVISTLSALSEGTNAVEATATATVTATVTGGSAASFGMGGGGGAGSSEGAEGGAGPEADRRVAARAETGGVQGGGSEPGPSLDPGKTWLEGCPDRRANTD